jgi:hypothetical protein
MAPEGSIGGKSHALLRTKGGKGVWPLNWTFCPSSTIQCYQFTGMHGVHVSCPGSCEVANTADVVCSSESPFGSQKRI